MTKLQFLFLVASIGFAAGGDRRLDIVGMAYSAANWRIETSINSTLVMRGGFRMPRLGVRVDNSIAKLAVAPVPAAVVPGSPMPEPRSVTTWLDMVKHGYGRRYAMYFDKMGIEDEEDVRMIRPARIIELREILAAANVKPVQIDQLTDAIDACRRNRQAQQPPILPDVIPPNKQGLFQLIEDLRFHHLRFVMIAGEKTTTQMVAEAMRHSGVPRGDMFIALHVSTGANIDIGSHLDALGTTYVDLMVVAMSPNASTTELDILSNASRSFGARALGITEANMHTLNLLDGLHIVPSVVQPSNSIANDEATRVKKFCEERDVILISTGAASMPGWNRRWQVVTARSGGRITAAKEGVRGLARFNVGIQHGIEESWDADDGCIMLLGGLKHACDASSRAVPVDDSEFPFESITASSAQNNRQYDVNCKSNPGTRRCNFRYAIIRRNGLHDIPPELENDRTKGPQCRAETTEYASLIANLSQQSSDLLSRTRSSPSSEGLVYRRTISTKDHSLRALTMALERNFLLPMAQDLVYGTAVSLDFSNSKILRRTKGTGEKQGAGLLWHVDDLAEKQGIKALVYLSDVSHREAPFTFMRRQNGTFKLVRKEKFPVAWGANRPPNWGGPPLIPKPWISELQQDGFMQHIVCGAAGTIIFFDWMIVHRGTVPWEGYSRDWIVYSITPRPSKE